MTHWWWLPLGLGVWALIGLEFRRRHVAREKQPNLVPRWKAFIESPAADGEPTIQPAAVPPVVRRRAKKSSRFRRMTAFR